MGWEQVQRRQDGRHPVHLKQRVKREAVHFCHRGGGVVAAAAFGYLLWQSNGSDAVPDGFARGNGRIEAIEIDVAPRLPGRIDAALVTEGELVEAGQPLGCSAVPRVQVAGPGSPGCCRPTECRGHYHRACDLDFERCPVHLGTPHIVIVGDVDEDFNQRFQARQQNLWVNSGSGRAPRA